MKYQNDYNGYIRKDGCLLCELVTQAELKAGMELNRSHFLALVEALHELSASFDPATPVLSDEADKTKPGAFVWDHERVANETMRMLGNPQWRLAYQGRIYMPWEELRGNVSFGDRVDADFVILQVLTEAGNGHFRSLNHDPYRPARKMVDLKSIRYYRWVVA